MSRGIAWACALMCCCPGMALACDTADGGSFAGKGVLLGGIVLRGVLRIKIEGVAAAIGQAIDFRDDGHITDVALAGEIELIGSAPDIGPTAADGEIGSVIIGGPGDPR